MEHFRDALHYMAGVRRQINEMMSMSMRQLKLKKEITMGTEKTYKLKGPLARDEYQGVHEYVVEVPAAELRRVLREEGAAINAGTISTFFGMTIESILELRRQYDLRGGPATITPETVRRTFAQWVERRSAQRRCHKTVLNTIDRCCSGQHGRRRGEVVKDQIVDRRVYARRRDARVSIFAGPDKRGAWVDRRAPHFRLERRVFNIPRRGPVLNPMFWLHRCTIANKFDNGFVTYLHSRFCPDCGLERTTFYDRRTGAAERRAT